MESTRRLGDEAIVLSSIVATMALVAAFAFRAMFTGWSFVWVPLVATLAATAVGLLGRTRSWLMGEVLLAHVGGYLLVGTIVVGGLPVPSSFLRLIRGAVEGWIGILDTLPPADAASEFAALPFTVAWVGTALGLEILRRSRRVGFAALGPAVGLAVSILFSAGEPRLINFQGATLAVLFLLLVSAQFQLARHSDTHTDRTPTRVVLGLGVLIIVAIGGPLMAARLMPPSPIDRVELRQYRPTPWDPLALPSPLAEIKGSLIGDNKDSIAFVITGEPVDRVGLATLEAYDGVVFAVAEDGQGPAEFRPAGPQLLEPTGRGTVEHTITISDLASSWLPVPRGAERVEFTSDDLQRSVRLNRTTGTLALTVGLAEGLSYTTQSSDAPAFTDEQLQAAEFLWNPDRFALEDLPGGLQNTAADLVEGVGRGWEQVDAIQRILRNQGFYSEEEVPPGHSYVNVAQFLGDLSSPVGFAEQYAASGAVLTRAIGVPSRVVVGFRIPDDRWSKGAAEVKLGDIDAWIEVLDDDLGWITVDVTPDKSREPEQAPAGYTTRIVAEPNPPPPPPTPTTSSTLPVDGSEDEEEEEEAAPDDGEDDASQLPWPVRTALIVASSSALALVLGIGAIAGAKVWLRHRRRTRGSNAKRVAAAWAELTDRFYETDLVAPPGATPTEALESFNIDRHGSVAGDTLTTLVASVDRAAFHPEPPSTRDREAAWELSDAAVSMSRQGVGGLRRLKMVVNPAALLRRRRPRRARKAIARQGTRALDIVGGGRKP